MNSEKEQLFLSYFTFLGKPKTTVLTLFKALIGTEFIDGLPGWQSERGVVEAI